MAPEQAGGSGRPPRRPVQPRLRPLPHGHGRSCRSRARTRSPRSWPSPPRSRGRRDTQPGPADRVVISLCGYWPEAEGRPASAQAVVEAIRAIEQGPVASTPKRPGRHLTLPAGWAASACSKTGTTEVTRGNASLFRVTAARRVRRGAPRFDRRIHPPVRGHGRWAVSAPPSSLRLRRRRVGHRNPRPAGGSGGRSDGRVTIDDKTNGRQYRSRGRHT